MAALRETRSRIRLLLLLAAAAIVVVAGAAAVALVRGGGPLGASLRLVALGADGVFGSDVQLAASGDSAVEGLPLVLGVVNAGLRSGRLRSVRLAVPAWVRLADADGHPLPGERTEGNPLAFVHLELAEETVEPGALPLVPAGLEHLHIAPVLSPVDCRLEWNGVPAFEPAPPWDVARLSGVSIYWAFEGEGSPQAGLLRTRLPVTAVRLAPVPMEFGEPEVFAGAAPWPAVGALSAVAFGPVSCGEPERPLDLLVMVWRVEAGGRMFVVLHDRKPRLVLFDLDDDGRIELEIRDANDDGVLETRRPVSWPVPGFLMPQG